MIARLINLVLFTIFLTAGSANAEVYKWRDSNGKLHFGDSPPGESSAEKLDEKELAARISSFTNVSVQITPIDFGVNKQTNNRQVIMYSTTRCPYCAKARAYFTKHGIDYVDRKIDKFPAFRKEFKAFGGKGVPVIFSGKYRMNGFNENNFAKMYAKSIQ